MKSPMIAIAFLTTSVIAGDFSRSCNDEHIEPSTQILTASCNTGDGKGTFRSTSLDLNSCFAYVGNKIQWSGKGNFGQVCDGCHIYRLPDPVYGPIFGTTRAWMNCTCNGISTESSIELDATPMSNKFGTLSCTS
ncbi:cvnh domain-containing protein [Colletotrichum incanum]|uniref:Cvnh domain-containing protein n=1 Tax=Colletotrichum incanum TaxID=1573173 RepID=A0A167CD47_COLIC|nr:cvnh domain-containing protein [Colletotrichum incanum]